MEEFSVEAPVPDDDKELEVLYDKKIEDLERVLDAPLHVLYLKQLSLLKERALRLFKQAMASSDTTEYEAMMQADEMFRKEALELTRGNVDWSFTKEAQLLKLSLQEVASKAKKLQDVMVSAAKQNEKAMDYLKMQQQQIQAMQQQMMSGGSPWNAAVAYRIPDTNFNIQCSYQQGRGNVQISCVPDEASSLLGANGKYMHT
ncbi:hypothetical protein EON65_04240 [archaeon]|nr:MAG: hypothetical protein EON65_04240 [archaeon]